MSKAERRHEDARIKKNRSKGFWGRKFLSERVLGIALHTAAVCSCPMCGNPRKFFGDRTVQERRAMQDVGE